MSEELSPIWDFWSIGVSSRRSSHISDEPLGPVTALKDWYPDQWFIRLASALWAQGLQSTAIQPPELLAYLADQAGHSSSD